MGEIWIVGSVNLDTTYQMECLPHEGETVLACGSFSGLGGKGSNQAAAACWTGVPTHLVGLTGDDGAGSEARKILGALGVDLQYLNITTQAPTGSAVICVDGKGANFILVNGGANQKLQPLELPLKPGDYVGAQLETPVNTVVETFRIARERGAVTVLNPSPYQPLSNALLAQTDMIVANEHEAGSITGIHIQTQEDVRLAAKKFAQMGIAKAVITLGSSGAAACLDGNADFVPGEQVHATDTQGAGDAFMGVLLGELAQGRDLLTATKTANHIAAMCVQTAGSTIQSLPEKGGIAFEKI